MSSQERVLDFEVLDQMSTAAHADSNGLAALRGIGPLVELEWLHSKGYSLPSANDLPPTLRSSALARALKSEECVFVAKGKQRAGFVRTLWNAPSDDQRLHTFCSEAQQAAVLSGIPRAMAQELVGAIGELEDNIHVHSENSSSGLLAFSASERIFEFVIADKGIGVLRSLETRAENRGLFDEGSALDAVVRNNVSRFGPNTGHGNGFRQLFIGLFNLKSFLRFRSGDFALTLDGRFVGKEKAELFQIVGIPGFVVSVVCHR